MKNAFKSKKLKNSSEIFDILETEENLISQDEFDSTHLEQIENEIN